MISGERVPTLRRHYGEDVDIAPGPAEILALAAASLADVPASDRPSLARNALELQRTRPDGSSPPPQAVEFHHDPLPPLIAALAHGEVPADAAPSHCWLLGTREDGRLEWHLAPAG